MYFFEILSFFVDKGRELWYILFCKVQIVFIIRKRVCADMAFG